MIKIKFDSASFEKEMNNVLEYSIGFLDGAKLGKKAMLKNIGESSIEMLKQFVDSNARVNPELLQHMYEWYRVGSPDARLFDFDYTISNLGLSFKSSFRQSTTVKNGSTVPFYDKARIMEYGIPVTIRPKRSQVLVFEDDGKTVFTKRPISIDNPGGTVAQGGFEKVIDVFFNQYFSQAFLSASGIADYLKNPVIYKTNLSRGKSGGRSVGVNTGYAWIANAGVER